MKKQFYGGVHPADKKELTKKKETIPLIRPEKVVIPLIQHIGAACHPLVREGDHVCLGQKIGDHEGMCVPVHASVSGNVLSITRALSTGGNEVPAIVIRNDGKNELYEGVKPQSAPENLTAEELFRVIREAGIAGMGGAAFPTEIKAVSGQNQIDTLIINACECEPYITADDALIRTEPEKVIRGICLLAKALTPSRIVLAIEDNKKEAAEALRECLPVSPQIEIKELPTRYPQGAEKQLIYAVTGREVPPGELPVNVACTVFNVSTAAAVCRAVYEGMPLVRRIVTVTGEGIASPQNFLVPVGTLFSELIKAAGGLTGKRTKVIAGGPMMGKAQSSLEVPVTKGTGAVLCLLEDPMEEKLTCIRCGKCVDVCPMYLQPLYLYCYEKAGNFQMLDKLHLADCMECGCCAYVCPGRLPLVEHFRAGKRALKEGKSR